jgi:flavodoxin
VTSLHILYASTSGHTEYVVGVLADFLAKHAPELVVTRAVAEVAQPDDFTKADVLLLASGTWNTGGIEGQLNPHMDVLLKKRAKDVDLAGKACAAISLGDDRYYYTGRAVEHLQQFIKTHNGAQALPSLMIVNEPYGQEDKVCKWGQKLLDTFATR